MSDILRPTVLFKKRIRVISAILFDRNINFSTEVNVVSGANNVVSLTNNVITIS